ncbi:MAG: trypsin-like peptidase domain-containing protein, partial [Myxococcales bacterium]|nr:trypsin-like peptidase domain-containing protein [Myxococcales bacterium]
FTRGLELQANFSNETFAQLQWFQLAVERSRAVGQVQEEGGREQGTGFLIDPKDFFVNASKVTAPVLLTNWHVISENGQFKRSLRPDRAFVRFGSEPERFRVKQIIASAPDLDATFVTLDCPPRSDRCPLKPPPLSFNREAPERVYVIGYPKGQGLSFSLHDSYWLGMDKTKLHYRTPTTPGSSGSPVFDQRNWEVVALHHGGGNDIDRLNGEGGVYQANEGILIEVIREAVKDSV